MSPTGASIQHACFTTYNIKYTFYPFEIQYWLEYGFIHLKLQYQTFTTATHRREISNPQSNNIQQRFFIFHWYRINGYWMIAKFMTENICSVQMWIEFVFDFYLFFVVVAVLFHRVEIIAIKLWWCVGKYIFETKIIRMHLGSMDFAFDVTTQSSPVHRCCSPFNFMLYTISYLNFTFWKYHSFTHLCDLFTRSTKIDEWNVYKVSTKAHGHRFLFQCILRS